MECGSVWGMGYGGSGHGHSGGAGGVGLRLAFLEDGWAGVWSVSISAYLTESTWLAALRVYTRWVFRWMHLSFC